MNMTTPTESYFWLHTTVEEPPAQEGKMENYSYDLWPHDLLPLVALYPLNIFEEFFYLKPFGIVVNNLLSR